VEVLSKKAKGMTRKEMIENARLSNGGGLTKTLEELELCGFIRRYRAFEKKERQNLFQLTMITTYGVKHNEYWGNIQSEVTMDDLFIK
jgi:hypothetical protein